MLIDQYGVPVWTPEIEEMTFPVQCKWCHNIHDGAKVTVIDRHADCSTWRCPGCKTLLDDRPIGWGGSAIQLRRTP